LNGYTGTVLAVEPRRISVKLDGGRTVDVDPATYPRLEWGYAVTTHKSQGMGDPLVVASITKPDDAPTAYVALMRCEEALHVHTRLLPEGPDAAGGREAQGAARAPHVAGVAATER
jgi:ATP-dependent exoDNAse (exonuclease V) alpha subunit